MIEKYCEYLLPCGWCEKFEKECDKVKSMPYLLEPIKINNFMPSVCDKCSNNPKNGGSGICNCTIPYLSDPQIMY